MLSLVPNPPVHATLPPPQRATPDVFDRSRFLLRQKHFSLSEKYFVWDDMGAQLMFVERPGHHLRSILALLGAAGAFLLTVVIVSLIASVLPEAIRGVFLAVSILVGGFGAALVTGVTLSVKRHVYFYRDESKRELLLKVEQDKKFQLMNATYTVKDRANATLAFLSKNYLYDMFRKRWKCTSSEGQLVCLIKEDSIVRSILRRACGPLFGLLRTNFVFLSNDTEIGRFDRQFTLLDRYVLDLSNDASRILDRRVALAIGVMLDTGEKR